jgi:hypothetical protein
MVMIQSLVKYFAESWGAGDADMMKGICGTDQPVTWNLLDLTLDLVIFKPENRKKKSITDLVQKYYDESRDFTCEKFVLGIDFDLPAWRYGPNSEDIYAS